MSYIAIEEHWTFPELARALDALPQDQRDESTELNDFGDNATRLEDLDEGRRTAMDAQGVDVQVLALAPPATQALPAVDAVPLSRRANDLASEAVRRHPDRFAAMATLPLSDPEAAAAELDRANGLGLVGAMVHGRTIDSRLDDPRFDDVLAVAEMGRHPLFIHPQIPPNPIRLSSYHGLGRDVELALSTFAWGWHLEAATATLRLIASGAFDRHPKLQIVLGHWGELLPFWSDRIESLSRVARLQRPVAEVMRENLHFTCSGMLSPALLHQTLSVTSTDRILFSTDYPFQHPTATEIQDFLREIPDPQDRDDFSFGNARRLFRIPLVN